MKLIKIAKKPWKRQEIESILNNSSIIIENLKSNNFKIKAERLINQEQNNAKNANYQDITISPINTRNLKNIFGLI